MILSICPVTLPRFNRETSSKAEKEMSVQGENLLDLITEESMNILIT